MSGTFGSFEIGRRAIHAQQKGAQVTGQNIANANTEGYSRQMVQLEAKVPPAVPGVVTPPGYGVGVADITRVKSEFYGNQLMKALNVQNYWESLGESLNGIEVIMQEPSEESINSSLGEFFDAWQELSVNPESHAARLSLREQAVSLSSVVRDIYSRLDEFRYDVQNELQANIKDINAISREITEMNEKIVYLEGMGKKSNELLDERDLRLQELSELVDVRVLQRDNGSVEVIAGGRTLLHDDRHFELGLDMDEMKISNSLGAELQLQGGKLKGLQEAYNETFPRYQGALDELVYGLVNAVNEQHNEGSGLDGSSGDFFEELPAPPDEEPAHYRAATNFYVHENILEDLDAIAAAQEPGNEGEEPAPGDGSNALAIAELRAGMTMADGSATFHDFLRGVIADLGVDGREAQRMSDSMGSVADNMREQQEAISSVSLDDEMLNMVQYQHAYSAAGRFLNTLDQMLGTLIAELGR